MTKSLISLLVGSHFVPPAKLLLEVLPAGAQLVLTSDHENPYDDQAIKVWVSPDEVPEELRGELDLKLPGMGSSWEELRQQPLVNLGHVAKSGGKPLLKASSDGSTLVGTVEFRSVIGEAWPASARLGFRGDGLLTVELVPTIAAQFAELDDEFANESD